MRLRSHEQRHADEADRDPKQPKAGHADVAEEAERDDGIEDRNRRLDDRREPRVDARLAPGKQPERDGDIHQPDDDEPPDVLADLPNRRRAAGEQRNEQRKRHRRESQTTEDERRRLELPHRDLDEEEARAPEQSDGGKHRVIAAHDPF